MNCMFFLECSFSFFTWLSPAHHSYLTLNISLEKTFMTIYCRIHMSYDSLSHPVPYLDTLIAACKFIFICVIIYLMCISWGQCVCFILYCIPMVCHCLAHSSELSKYLWNKGKILVGNVVDPQTPFNHTFTIIHITRSVHEVEVFE